MIMCVKKIGDGCGTYIETDEETLAPAILHWARILVRLEGKEFPSSIQIFLRDWSFKVKLWCEIPPTVPKFEPAKRAAIPARGSKHEGEDFSRTNLCKCGKE